MITRPPIDKVTVELPGNLAAFIYAYFCCLRWRVKRPMGPNLGATDFTPLQDKFMQDIAQNLHNITGLGLSDRHDPAGGAAYFFKHAPAINAAWLPVKEQLLFSPGQKPAYFEHLFPLPEKPGSAE